MTLAPHSQRKRYRPTWDALIDFMIAKPGATAAEMAAHINRKPVTISMILNSDLFKAHYAQRRHDFNIMHDGAIMDKTVRIAHASLDAILTVVEKKKDSIPLATLQSVSDSALSRLGYGAKTPEGGTHVNVNVNTATQVVAPVSREDLLEARMAYRQVQEMRARGQLIDATVETQRASSGGDVSLPAPVAATEAEPVKSDEQEGTGAPSTPVA